MLNRIVMLLRKHRELVSYVFWGVMTTIVNYVVYFLLTEGLQVYYLTGNVIAWAISVLFAYFVNKLYVFQSRDWAGRWPCGSSGRWSPPGCSPWGWRWASCGCLWTCSCSPTARSS